MSTSPAPDEKHALSASPTTSQSSEPEKAIPTEVQSLIDACVCNAEDLVKAAELLLAQNLSNIAYHLGALALEEIGKSEIVGVMHAARVRKGQVSDRHLDDHVRKLFWALWGPSFGHQLISGAQLEAYRGLAANIHETRLQGLYVSTSEREFVNPREAISKEQSETIVSMARARLELAKLRQPVALGEKDRELLAWFLAITEDEEKRRWLFSKESMEKLVEVHEVKTWMQWCREHFEAADAAGRALAEKELKREEPSEEEGRRDKWKIKTRLYSDSHSIRNKDLNAWNAMPTGIKLFPVGGKKNQLICEMTLPSAVPIDGLWWLGWGASRRFVAALNIGSLGFFWWYLPEQISKFYEEIQDVENDAKVLLERSPRLKIGWGNHVLTSQVLNRVALCFGMLPGPQNRELHKPFDHYLTGLGFLSKTDVHMQFELNAFTELYRALRYGMLQYGDWDSAQPFLASFESIVEKCVTNSPDAKSLMRFAEIGEGLENNKLPAKPLDLGDVGMMKVLADSYFLWRFDQLARQRASTGTSENSSGRR